MLRSQPIKAERVYPGEHYSVMSRHTLNDGKTPDHEIVITPEQHLVELAPPAKLVGDWYRGRLGEQNTETFEGSFRDRYLDHLLSDKLAKRAVADLGARALIDDITVMCIEETPDSGLLLCHRRLLLEHAREMTPGLETDIR